MNWIQRVPLGQRLLLLVPYKSSYAAALWQWLRVAVVRGKCHAWLGHSHCSVLKRCWQCMNWIQYVRLGRGKQLACANQVKLRCSAVAVTEGSRGA